jgi:hypothetical protein
MNAALISKPVNGVAIQSAEKCLGNDSARSTDSRPWIQAPISVLSEAPLQDTSSTCVLAPSGPRPIAKIDPSITETALVQEIKLSVNIAGQDRDVIANQYRHHEEMILVDEPGVRKTVKSCFAILSVRSI